MTGVIVERIKVPALLTVSRSRSPRRALLVGGNFCGVTRGAGQGDHSIPFLQIIAGDMIDSQRSVRDAKVDVIDARHLCRLEEGECYGLANATRA
jgi:hypothetical protein